MEFWMHPFLWLLISPATFETFKFTGETTPLFKTLIELYTQTKSPDLPNPAEPFILI